MGSTPTSRAHKRSDPIADQTTEGALSVTVIIPTIDILSKRVKNCLAATNDTDRIIAAEPGATFAENCNLAAEDTDAEILVFLNDDTIPHEGWFAALLEPFQDERVGIVGARLVYPEGHIQHAGVTLDYQAGVVTAHNVLTDEPSRYVEAVTGACMAVRAETFSAASGFNEEFRNGYEDVDLCLRAREQGWRVWYTADATVTHLESQSGPQRWAHVRENVALLDARWNGKI